MDDTNKPENTLSCCLVEAAKNLAFSIHHEKRKNYDLLYTTHLGRVATYVEVALTQNPSLHNNKESDRVTMIAASWLHDSIEDHPEQENVVKFCMPDRVVNLILELTNVPKKAGNREERKALDNERLGKASRAAKIIKLADRYDNIQDLIVAFTKGQIDEGYYYMYLNETFDLLNHIKVDDCVLYDELYKTVQLV